jgi:hypothetical protein
MEAIMTRQRFFRQNMKVSVDWIIVILILLIVNAVNAQVATNPVLSKQELKKDREQMHSPEIFAFPAYALQYFAKSAENFQSDQIRIPLYLKNSVKTEHPGLIVKGGVPLPKGVLTKPYAFRVLDEHNQSMPGQINESAYWPDGSIKWLLLVMNSPVKATGEQVYHLELLKNQEQTIENRINVEQENGLITVNTGKLEFSLEEEGNSLFRKILMLHENQQLPVFNPDNQAALFAQIVRKQDAAKEEKIHFDRMVKHSVQLEEAGPERVVILVEGVLQSVQGEEFAPFQLRIYAHAGSSQLRFVHFFIYNGNPEQDFLTSVGFRLNTAFSSITAFSVSGVGATRHKIEYNPSSGYPLWSKVALIQNSSNAFKIQKWIDPVHNSAVKMLEGKRSAGWGSLASDQVVLTAGIRNFWQEYPRALEIDAGTQELTLYFYSPYGDKLDLRRYSDSTYNGLYETSLVKNGNSLVGPTGGWQGSLGVENMGAQFIGKTSEFFIDFASPDLNHHSAREAVFFQDPPVITASPEWMAASRVWGDYATASSPGTLDMIQPLQQMSDFLQQEQEYRNWYGFLDYGDVIHSFDPVRDIWRRDQGGYAWNNNEHLVAEAIWMSYLVTGDLSTFRFAEAMTRHVGDVDMYHLGPLRGNGTRHNVNHYGGITKKRRMTLPENKRLYYYLTGDEHTRDLIHFIYQSFFDNLKEDEIMRDSRNTMDLAVYASALMFLWETTNDPKYGKLLKNTTETMVADRINGRGIRRFVQFDLHSGVGKGVEGDHISQPSFFFLKFGPADLLLNTVELTQSKKVHQAIMDWAGLFKLDPEKTEHYQSRMEFQSIGSGKMLAYAYRYTHDPVYLEFIKNWVQNPLVSFNEVGGDGLFEAPVHKIPINPLPKKDPDSPFDFIGAKLQMRDMADYLRNAPFCYPVLISGEALINNENLKNLSE